MTVVLLGVLQWALFGSQVVEAPGVARGTPGECMDVACIDVGVMKEAIGPGTLCALEVTEMSCCIQYSCECNEDTPDPADCKTWSVIAVCTATSWTQSMTDCFATQQCSGSQFCGDATPANLFKKQPVQQALRHGEVDDLQQTRLVNNDGFLDASCANSVNRAGSILIGHGAALDPPVVMPTAQQCEADARPRV